MKFRLASGSVVYSPSMPTAGAQNTASSQNRSSHSPNLRASSRRASRKRNSAAAAVETGSTTMPPFAALHHREPTPVHPLHRDFVVPAVAGGLRRHAKLARGSIGAINPKFTAAAHAGPFAVEREARLLRGLGDRNVIGRRHPAWQEEILELAQPRCPHFRRLARRCDAPDHR